MDKTGIKDECERLIKQAITEGCMVLANGHLYELTATQILSVCKKYLDSDELKDRTEEIEPSDISILLGD